MGEAWESAFERVCALEGLAGRSFKTPIGKPFKVGTVGEDALEVRTSTGGRVSLRCEAFDTAPKLLADLGAQAGDEGPPEERGWVPLSDETLQEVLRAQNRDNAASSYVLPLLEAAGLVEIRRTRPILVRARS